MLESSPLLQSGGGMVQPGDVAVDGPVVSSVIFGELHSQELGQSSFQVAAQGFLIQMSVIAIKHILEEHIN